MCVNLCVGFINFQTDPRGGAKNRTRSTALVHPGLETVRPVRESVFGQEVEEGGPMGFVLAGADGEDPQCCGVALAAGLGPAGDVGGNLEFALSGWMVPSKPCDKAFTKP
jgi:hypothetical protein